MADYNSSLPVRTETNGDVAVKVVDGTIVSQALSIDSSGRVTIKLDDGAGNIITSQVNGTQRALDVGINVAGVQVDPRQIRALTAADIVTVQQGTSPWVTKDQSDGPVTPGAVASFSNLIGGQYNTSLPTLTAAQQAAIQLDSSGRLILAPLTSASIVTVSNLPTTVDTNYGTVGTSTLRVASQIGNSTGAASFNNGTTGAQTLRVAANLAIAGADVTALNPVPVVISQDNPGTEINDFNQASSIAAAATSNHDYTVTVAKTLLLTQITAAASGKMKTEVQIETGVGTGVFTSKFVQFNSTAEPNIQIALKAPISVAAGVRVRIIRTNTDNQSQNLYSTISGQEI